ncbi:DUF1833 family protein [Pseudoalteromonas gelatinilytica]|uniref:DUF1833 domain-containing protein n=1 Tax=Pseudoalteromonas gelatinilytica TaxID=1703256 RepID=A0ABQ1TZS5_9GAMM|nr:DUF1833 family protein [Pseudoalteromonas profundi]GGF06909.1 hypothetical protein GCM10008027_34780 [Pseudoalteromonas profundi]
MSEVLQRLFASAPTNDLPIHSLELQATSFGVIRICSGFDDVTAGIEGGEMVAFEACALGVSLPERSVKGRQDLQFQLDNITGQSLEVVETAFEAGEKVKVIYRVYTASYLDEPGERPLEMTAVSVKANALRVNVVASFNDLVNAAWPTDRYTPDFAPGLQYFS